MTRHRSSKLLSTWKTALVALALVSGGCHWRSSAERAAESIADKNAAARGGLKAWRRIQAMSMTGTLEAGMRRDPVQLAMSYARPESQVKAEARLALAHPGERRAPKQVELPFVMELKRPRMTRLEIRFQGQTAVQAFDGKNGWKLRPFLGRREVEPFTTEERRVASQQTELDGLLIDHAAKGYRVKLLGTEAVESRDAYALEVTTGEGDVRHVWVDTQTSLEVKVDGTRKMDGKSRKVWTYLREYRPVDGLMIPHLLETSVEGAPGSEKIRIERVALNPKLDDARFATPD